MTERLSQYMALDEIPIKLNSDQKILEYTQKLIVLHNELVKEVDPSKASFVFKLTKSRLVCINQAVRLNNLNEIKIAYSGNYMDFKRSGLVACIT